MKKSLLILGALAAMSMIFMGCPNSTQTSDPTEALEDKVIWSSDAGETFTSEGYSIALSLDEVLDLTGYKYLNVEFEAAGNVSGQNVIVQPMNAQNGGGHPQGNILQGGAVARGTFQTKFGTNYGTYTDWSTGSAVEKTISDNDLGSVQLYVQETTNWGTVDGVEITVYKVTATNTAL
ncbi:MAG: hypothetical protein K6D95_09170 [Treponema sp.]|nr:hypothetical protein [Treponema sp.]